MQRNLAHQVGDGPDRWYADMLGMLKSLRDFVFQFRDELTIFSDFSGSCCRWNASKLASALFCQDEIFAQTAKSVALDEQQSDERRIVGENAPAIDSSMGKRPEDATSSS